MTCGDQPLLLALAILAVAYPGDAGAGARGFELGTTADLALTKEASASEVSPGDSLDYELTVTNNGPASAVTVLIVDTLPAGVTLVSFTSSTTTTSGIFADGFETGDTTLWESGCSDICCESAGIVTCDLGTLASGAGATVTLTTEVSDTATETLLNSAEVGSEVADSVSSNDIASAGTSITGSGFVDLELSISDSPDPVAPGGSLSYTFDVTNDGPGVATGVILDDSLPPELTVVSAVSSQGSCRVAGNEVSCDLGTMAVRAVATVALDVSVSASASGAITNGASVDSDQNELDFVDNVDTEVTTVQE